MILRELGVRSFRNLSDAELRFEGGTTLLLGENGQGKTSLLEAIGVLASSRSFRKARPSEMAAHGNRGFAVSGSVEGRGGLTRLAIEVEGTRRTMHVGGAPSEPGDYISHLTVVPVTQAHAAIVRGAPQDRRDFLDRGLLGVKPAYLRVLASYRHTLRQKNALLRMGGSARPSDAELGAWNDRLARDGAEITLRRREYTELLRAALAEVGPRYLPASEQLVLSLHDAFSRDPGLPTDADRDRVALSLMVRIDGARARELASGSAVIGPHRDDLRIAHVGNEAWPDRDLRRAASSGQQRNALLALKMAKVEAFWARRGEAPVLLVDDVDTEVDPRRLGTFLEHVGERAQALITSSKRELLGSIASRARAWRVERGVLRPA